MPIPMSSRRIAGLVALIALMAASLPSLAIAQESTPETEENRRTITVEGTGTVDVAPDTADITLGVMIQDDSLETAQTENTTRTQAIMDALSEAGIPEEDIATSRYMVFPINEYDRDGNLVGIQSYEVTSTVDVTIRDLSIVGEMLDQAVSAGANQVNSIDFYVDNTDEPAREARRMAIEHAREKADEMAEAAGVIVVGVYEIEETSTPDSESVRFDIDGAGGGMEEMQAAGDAAMNVPVSPGQTEVTVKVRVVFEIDQPLG